MKAFLVLLLFVAVASEVTWVSNEEFNEVQLQSNGIVDIVKCLINSRKIKTLIADITELIREKKFDPKIITDIVDAYKEAKTCINPKIIKINEYTLTEKCEISCKRTYPGRTCTRSCKPRYE